MTGFGRAEHATDTLIARVEISSVNRKQADIVFNLPRELTALDAPFRKLILEKVSRGRVNVNLQLERAASAEQSFQINFTKALALESAFQQLSNSLGRTLEPTASDFLRASDIFSFEEGGLNPEEARAAIEPALTGALEKLIAMRKSEGSDLKDDLLARLEIIEQHATVIGQATGQVATRQRELLHQRLRDQDIELDLNDERLVKEIALFAERVDISEETTRLTSHISRFREYLSGNDAVGRSLDFLCQELNRELNTIGSKCNDAGIAQNVVNAKTELEKIREQVQNIE